MIQVNQPILDGKEKDFLIKCIDTGWISSEGPYVKEFEQKFSNYIGCEYGVAVCNGTVSLETALYALGVGVGDEVIIPSFTIISCAIACIRLGAIPVLVDIEPETWNLDVTQLEQVITPRTRTIIAVHMYGHPCDMDSILAIAKKHNLTVLEDAAQVHGALYKGRKCGSMGDAGSFSFYANKIITTGEGGMVVTSNPRIAERARSYRNLCFQEKKRYFHEDIGNNYRLTNLQAAVGLAQLERIEEFVDRKRQIGEYYVSKLRMLPGIKTQIEKSWAKMVYWMYCVELDPSLGVSAEQVMFKLQEKGIGCRAFFIGLHEQPALHNRGFDYSSQNFPVTEHASKYGFYLPSSLSLSFEQIDFVVDTLGEILKDLKSLTRKC